MAILKPSRARSPVCATSEALVIWISDNDSHDSSSLVTDCDVGPAAGANAYDTSDGEANGGGGYDDCNSCHDNDFNVASNMDRSNNISAVRDTSSRKTPEEPDAAGSGDVFEDWNMYDGLYSDPEDGVAGNVAAVDDACLFGRNEGIDAAVNAIAHEMAVDGRKGCTAAFAAIRYWLDQREAELRSSLVVSQVPNSSKRKQNTLQAHLPRGSEIRAQSMSWQRERAPERSRFLSRTLSHHLFVPSTGQNQLNISSPCRTHLGSCLLTRHLSAGM